MKERLIKGVESSYATMPAITFPFLVLYLTQPVVILFSMKICVISFILMTSIFLFVLVAGSFTIVITESKITVQKYFLFILIDNVEFDRADIENFDENNSIFDFSINSDYDKIILYRHVPSFDIDDEPWLSIESKNKKISIRTLSEKKSIYFFNEIKQAIRQTKN